MNEIDRGSSGTPAAYSACDTRWASSACTPAVGERASPARPTLRAAGSRCLRRRRGPRGPPRARCRERRSRREERRADVALARVGQDRHDPLARASRAASRSGPPPTPRRRRRSPPARPRGARTARAVSIASSSSTGMISSITSRFSTSGTKPGADALDLVRPGRAARQHRRRRSAPPPPRAGPGCAPSAARRTPVIVPPVPTPATNTSTVPSVSRQISSAVVRRWISGLAGFENWFGTKQSPRSRQIRRASSTASFIPPIDSTQHHLGAVQPQQLLALAAHALGHRDDEVVALRRAHERERDAGVAGGGLDDRAPARLDPALGLGRLDHRHADPVLDAAARVVATRACRSARRRSRAPRRPSLHQRRVADEVREVVGYRPGGRRDAHPAAEGTGRAVTRYSQKAMNGTPMIVVLWVCVLTPNMMRPPLCGRFGVFTSVSWKT